MPDLQFSDHELSELRDAFNLFDKDGDGGITQAEMASVMSGFGETVDESVLAPLFRAADANGDGHLQWEEFVALVQDLDPDDDADQALHRSLVIFLEIRGG